MQSDETKHQSSSKEQIEEKLEKARFRYNLFKSEKTYLTLLTIGLAIVLITIIVQKFFHIPYYVYVVLGSSFTIYFLLSLVGTIKNWTGKSEAASILDKKMHFKERLVTGLEYAEQKEKNKLFGMLANDITSKLDNKSIKTTLPHKLPRATKYFIPVSILLLIILLLPHMYPEESGQIVTNIKKSIIETPDLINKSMKKFSKSDTAEPKDSEVEKKDKLKQEEKPKEPQNEQEGKKLAETKTEKSEEEQDKKKGQQLQAQTTKDKTNSLQD